jgi:membrane protein implicated in regulation of membrane protease activity
MALISTFAGTAAAVAAVIAAALAPLVILALLYPLAAAAAATAIKRCFDRREQQARRPDLPYYNSAAYFG